MSAPDRRAMVERPGKDLSVRRQCALLSVARSGAYRLKPVPGADDLAVMRRIDELHLELPFYGSRRMTFELNKEGRGVNRKRVRRLMRVMGIEALVPRPGTSKAAPGHKIYPYLLRGLKIVEPNPVWAADVTFIPMACGFLYLVVIIDWASRTVLAWRLSNTNDASFCAAALEEALLRFGTPRIFNTDQGSTALAAAQAPTVPASAAPPDDGQWTMPAKNYAATRFSALDEINSANVSNLQVAFAFSTGVDHGQEAAPIVANNTMFIVTPYPNVVFALDLTKPGAPIKWSYRPYPAAASQGVACCDVVNRGATYSDGKVFFNTLDDNTIALDA